MFLLLALAALLTGPGMWENLPTCDMTQPIPHRCREVRGQWGGVIGGRVHDGGEPR